MIIPPEQLPAETLHNILEEFITREGTDYGAHELTLEQKVEHLKPQVLAGRVLIIFDELLAAIQLVDHQDYQDYQSLAYGK